MECRSLALSALLIASTACSSSSNPAAPGDDSGTGTEDSGVPPQADAGPVAQTIYTVIITAPLAGPAAAIEPKHDSIFNGLKGMAAQLGNVGHAVFLDATTSKDALFVDTWDSKSGLDQLLGNPSVQQADSTLFAAPPSLSVVTARTGWHTWGTFGRTAPDGTPVGAVLIRGTLAGDPATAEEAHNSAVQGLQAMFNAAGDVGHLVYLDPTDAQTFIAIDLWKDVAASQALYSMPAFKQGLSKVLAGPPTATAYAPTTWSQW